MSSRILSGGSSLIRGFTLITRPGIRPYVIVPLLINMLLFAAVITLGAHWLGALIDSFLPDWLSWLSWLLWPLFAIISLGLVFFSFSIVANLIGAPFNGMLAAAVEKHLTGQPPASPPGPFLEQVRDALLSELRKLLYFLKWAVPVLLLFLIPGLQMVAPLLWFLFGAWMLAIEYADYPMGNQGLDFPAQRRILASHRPASFGFGASAMLLTLLPVLNFIAMPVAVAGATAWWVEHLRNSGDPLPGASRPGNDRN